MANEKINTTAGLISAIVAVVLFSGTVWKYLKIKYGFKDKLREFNKRKEALEQFRDSTKATRDIQLRVPGKVVRKDVIDWLEAVRVEISDEQSVEYLVKQKGILSLFYRTEIVKTRIADLDRTFESGDRIRQVPWLVEDDASLERFTKLKEKLKAELGDVKARLTSQLLVPGKIEAEKVKLWRGKVEEITGQTATDIEAKFNGRVPQEPQFPDLVIQKIREMGELCNEGTQLPESLAVDDFSKTLGDDEKKSFGDWKEKLQVKHKDVKEKLSTELCQNPEKIVTEQVEQWLQKVEGIIIPAASDVQNQLNSRGPPYLAPLVNRVKDLIPEMEELCNEGDQLLTEILVDDDYSLTLSDDDRKTFAHCKEKLWGKFQDVERISQLQLRSWMIETEQVKIWKKQVAETTASAVGVQNQLDREPPYTAPLVRRVKNLIQEMEKLHDDGCKLPESLVIPDPSASAPLMPVPVLRGSDAVKTKILEHLMGDETTKIGVWGMGGVGKTTIMKHVYNQLLNESKFKKVIWVTVSQTFDVRRIQQEIVSSLQEDKNLPNHQGGDLRAAVLSKMLEMYKPYVLILDDVWERFELYEVGLPEIFDEGSKLVLTTRSEEVARVMGCERVKVNTLPWEKSLKLFKDTAGVEALSDDGGAEGTLEEMVHECGGLPLAIKTVAASMKGISDPRLWRAALNQLKQGRRNVAGTENDQFRVLKFSYDWLGNTTIQHCFLHCVLFPEDAMILTEDLIDYWIDWELIDVEGTSQDMKDEGHDILKKLVGNCLLEFVRKRSGRDCVKMHDVMRDMALWITRSSGPRFLVKAGVGLEELPEEHEWKKDLSKVSLMRNHIKDIPSSMPSPTCPILTTLLLSSNTFSTIPENFFKHMSELKVLDLSYNEKLRSLPSSVSSLVKLTTLLLRKCNSLKWVPSLSKLNALKKLDLYTAGVEEVPDGLEMLLNLKYLDIGRGLLRYGSRHEKVSARWENFVSEILPTLSKLQHLGLHHKLPVEGRQLGCLTKLESFYGSVRTWSDMCSLFSSGRQSLYQYNVSIGVFDDYLSYELKSICFSDTEICGKPGLTLTPSDVQRLDIRRCNGVRSFYAVSGFVELQECSIWGCREVEYVFSGLNQLPKLKKLRLGHMENLKGLFDSEAALVFPSLEVISITSCPKMKKLFPTTWQNLPNLKEILVKDCRELEEIMVASSSSSEGRVVDAKLEKLTLENLPVLKSISSPTVASVFGCLKELEISRCPNLNGYIFGGQFKFSSLHSLETLRLAGLHSLKSIFDEEADESHAPTFPFPLGVLEVEDCPQLKKIFPHAVQIDSFQNLVWMTVKGCKELGEIMAVSSEREEDQSKPILPKLEYLNLIELPVLKRICSVSVVPDSLRDLTIQDCPDLKWECLFSSRKLPQTLEFIQLKGVRDLELIYDDGEASDCLAFFRSASDAATSFALRGILVENCPQLKRIFTFGRRLDSFQYLNFIKVNGCDGLEEIMATSLESDENQSKLILPALVILGLTNLPALKRFCGPIASLVPDSGLTIEPCLGLCWELPQKLVSLSLKGVRNIVSVFDDEASDNSLAFWRLPPAATSTFALRTICIENCPQLKKIFSHAGLLDSFENIRSIEVQDCDELEEIISAKSEESIKVTHLPKLTEFNLRNLPKLKRACTGTSASICDSLKYPSTSGCPELEWFPSPLPESSPPRDAAESSTRNILWYKLKKSIHLLGEGLIHHLVSDQVGERTKIPKSYAAGIVILSLCGYKQL